MASYTVQMDGSQNYSLTLTVTQTSQNTVANTSVVSWNLRAHGSWGSYGNYATSYSIHINGIHYGGTIPSFNPNPSMTIRSGSTTIPHNADGTKTIYSSGWWNSGHSAIGQATTGGNLTLTTIPRASQSSWAPGTVSPTLAGNTYTLNTNRASSSFTHNITYSFNGETGTIGNGVGASVAWTIPMSTLNRIPNSMSGTGVIITKTYSGSSYIGTKNSNFAITAPSTTATEPTWTSVSAVEGNSAVTTKMGAGSPYIQGISKVSYAINGAAGVYSSTIAQQTFQVAGQTIQGATGVTAEIGSSGTVPAVFTIKDTRGRTKTQTNNLTVLPYATPVIISSQVYRALSDGTSSPDDGTYLRVVLNSSVSSLINGTQKNTRTIKVRARLRGSTTPWTDASTLKSTTSASGISGSNSITVTGPFDVDKSYEVRVEVTDAFNTSASDSTIAVAAIFMHWGTGLGVKKYWEQGAIDAGGDIYQKGQKVLSLQQTLYFTSSGTFTKATYPWLTQVRVRLVGGGGAGGGAYAGGTGHSSGGGGGGGGYAERIIPVADLATSVTVTVGAGGIGATSAIGSAGGASSFGSTVAASGGGGGDTFTANTLMIGAVSGDGGEGTAGSFTATGDPGVMGSGYATLAHAGSGGGSMFGGGGRGSYTGANAGTSAGVSGGRFGGGGGGARSNQSGTAAAGGDGAAGLVIVELYA